MSAPRPPHAVALTALALLTACTEKPAAAKSAPVRFTLEKVADGFDQPLYVTHAGDGSGRLFVVEQTGKIRIVQNGQVLPRPFLDVSDLLHSARGEMGLLGLAFHPQYKENGRFFIGYTQKGLYDAVAELQVDGKDKNRADKASLRVLLSIKDPAGNHNGGMLLFGPDGYLYVGTGDGGAANDKFKNSRDKSKLLAKMLRLDVDKQDAGKGYAVPKTNPFVGQKGVAPEIWATGLRNPWRYSFDRKTGDLWIGDVGQNKYEEIHRQPAKSNGGEDYGWNVMEASHCFVPPRGCAQKGLEMPVAEYDHDKGCSVTGGYVYRGKSLPGLDGVYLFGDYCTGTVWGLFGDLREKTGYQMHLLAETKMNISSFGEDEAGELYLTDHQKGRVYRFAPAPKP